MRNPQETLEKYTQVLFDRLTSIKNAVDTKNFTSISQVKKEIGGATNVYYILADRKLLYINKHDRMINWKMNIKITKALAKSIAEEAIAINKKYKDNSVAKKADVAKPILKSVQNSKSVVSCEPLSKPIHKAKSKITNTTEPQVSMSFFWGLFTYTKN